MQESTYKSGLAVQTTGATSIRALGFNVRQRLTMASRYESALDNFESILNIAKKTTTKYGSKLYFVYLPDYYRYHIKIHGSGEYIFYGEILEIVRRLSIPVIDLHREGFASISDPSSLFPFRVGSGHYNIEGFRLVAETIAKRLIKDGFIPTNSQLNLDLN